jgi:hypothetical protein
VSFSLCNDFTVTDERLPFYETPIHAEVDWKPPTTWWTAADRTMYITVHNDSCNSIEKLINYRK